MRAGLNFGARGAEVNPLIKMGEIMSDSEKKQQEEQEAAKKEAEEKKTEELSDDDLDNVAGGAGKTKW